MIRIYRFRLELHLAFLLLTSCTSIERSPDISVYAKVGNDVLTQEIIDLHFPAGVYESVDSIRIVKKIQSDWVREQLLIRHAEELRIQQSDVYRNELNRFQQELTLRLITEEILKNNPTPFDVSVEEATIFYQANRDQLSLDEEFVRIRSFSSSSRRDAQSARQALLRGEDWEKIVSQYSIRPDEQQEVEALYFPARVAFSDVPPLNRMIRNLGITEVSEIIEYKGLFHFAQLMEEVPSGEVPNLEWTIQQIQRWLQEEKKRKFLNSYIRNLYLQSESRNELFIRDLSSS